MKAADLIRAHPGKVVGLAFLIALALFYPREQLEYVSNSPDAAYRLEYYTPHWLQGVWCYYVKNMRSATIVRLYRNSDNAYFGESPVIDLSAGNTNTWAIEQMGEVSVGMEYVFTNVPPASERGPPP